MQSVFKPENVYFIQGHGSVISKEHILDSQYGPLHLEFDRFFLPSNVFTASSREIGLNTPPDDKVIFNLVSNKENLLLPIQSSSYAEYTKQLRDLGKELFTVLVKTGDRAEETWKGMVNQYGKDIPEIIHTHGPVHEVLKNQSVKDYRRDLFLFSAPNDALDLGARSLQTLGFNKEGSKSKILLKIWDGWFVSGIAPLNELASRDPELLNQFRLVMPSSFFSKCMKDLYKECKKLSDSEIEDWKEMIQNQYSSGKGRDPRDKEYDISEMTNEEFREKIIERFLNKVKACYFWEPTYENEAKFFEKSIDSLQFRMNSKDIVDTILNFREKKGLPNEPILVLFYHCRTIGSNLGNVYGKAFESMPPSISRSLSTSAATGVENTTLPSNTYFKFRKGLLNYRDKIKTISLKNKYSTGKFRAETLQLERKIKTLEKQLSQPTNQDKQKIQEDIQKKQNELKELQDKKTVLEQKSRNLVKEKTQEIDAVNGKEIVDHYNALLQSNLSFLTSSNKNNVAKLKQKYTTTSGGKGKTKRRTKRKSITRRKY